MAMFPYVLREIARPLKILENHLRMSEELMRPFASPYFESTSRVVFREVPEEHEKIVCDEDKFQVKLDVQKFSPEEITVKTTGANEICIEAKHEKDTEQNGYTSRHLVRKFVLSDNHDLKDLVSSLSSDGILTVTAPRKLYPSVQERVVNVSLVGPERSANEKVGDK